MKQAASAAANMTSFGPTLPEPAALPSSFFASSSWGGPTRMRQDEPACACASACGGQRVRMQARPCGLGSPAHASRTATVYAWHMETAAGKTCADAHPASSRPRPPQRHALHYNATMTTQRATHPAAHVRGPAGLPTPPPSPCPIWRSAANGGDLRTLSITLCGTHPAARARGREGPAA